MPDLSDSPERLQAALTGRKHWVFVTDLQEAHLCLASLAMALIGRGRAKDADLDYGVVETLDCRTGRRRKVSVLAVPKHLLSGKQLHRLLSAWGTPCSRDDSHDATDGQDHSRRAKEPHGDLPPELAAFYFRDWDWRLGAGGYELGVWAVSGA